MTTNPRVSVVVPIYNVSEFIDECVQSIIQQTYTNLEIILVNDGSTDDSLEKCQSLERLDSRISIVDKKNGGLSSARNAGIEVATGDYITFIDGDDVISCLYVEQLLFAISAYESEVAICNLFEERSEETKTIIKQIKKYSNIQALKLILKEKRITTSACAKLFKKSLFDDSRFWEGKIYEDYDLIPHILFAANSVAHVDSNSYFYRTNPNSITKVSFNPKRLQYFEVSDRIESFLSDNVPNLLKYALNRRTRYSISFYRQVSSSGYDDQATSVFLVKNVRKGIIRYVFSSYNFFSKLAGIMISISPKTAKRILK